MSGLPWYKCYPRDFNDGMVGLTMEERGAYVTILNCIYQRGTPVQDDPVFWRALLNCSGKAWGKVRSALIVKGRLFEVDFNGKPCLMDERAASEIATQNATREKLSEAGNRRVRKSAPDPSENNDITPALAEPALSLGTVDTDTDTEVTTVANAPVVLRAPKAKAVRRCPADWTPSPDDIAVGLAEGLSPGEIERALSKMKDHQFKSARSDWSATFRNWLRSDAERKPRNDRPDRLTAKQANLDRGFRAAESVSDFVAAHRTF